MTKKNESNYIKDFAFLFFTDKSEVFGIHPQQAKIKGNHSLLFEVCFDPEAMQMLYSIQLMARIFRLPCCEPNIEITQDLLANLIPDAALIRLIGTVI